MNDDLPPIRRIVTGIGPEGRSRIIEDGPPPVISKPAARPGMCNANIWSTSTTPVPVDEPDRIANHNGLYPPKNGTVIRIMDIPPESAASEMPGTSSTAPTEGFFPDMHRRQADTSRHPRMHITDTVDYAIILFGEMYAVMEDGEALMKAGDVLVQRGTNHAWSNRSEKICRVAFILVDGSR